MRLELKRHAATSPLHRVAFLASSPEAVPVAADTSNPKWIHVCTTGVYRGYRGGGATFVIDDQVLDKMIANLRAHPSYVAGVDKLPAGEVGALVDAGKVGVVPYDIDHGHGPSQAWGLEMQRRPLASGTGSGLWIYTYLLEPAYTWMVENRFKWTSIEWEEDATHPVSGAKIGPYVIRVALTNDPFVQGMTAIQQSRDGRALAQTWDPWCPPRTPSELLGAVRKVFGLAEMATLEEVLGAVAKLRSWTGDGLAAPPGVDVAHLVGELRLLLNLPTLTDPASIFAELDKLLGALAAEQEEEHEPMATAPVAPPAAPQTQDRVPEIVQHFARRLSVDPSEPVVTIELERRLSSASDAMAMISALSKALNVSDPKELAAKITELAALDARMKEIIPEMEAQDKAMEHDADAMAQQDVAAVMATRRLPEAVQHALLLERRGGSSDYFASLPRKDRAEKRAEARTAFFKRYEISTVDVPLQYRHLHGPTLFAGPTAVYSPLGAHDAHQLGARPGTGAQPVFSSCPTWGEINAMPGANDAERVREYVIRQDPKLSYDVSWARAHTLRAELIRREGPSPF